MTKIYFAGSIRGGRSDLDLYRKIISYLQLYGEVLTEHIGDSNLTPLGETGMTDREIYDRDMAWLSSCDILVAELTVPSLGVGFEVASAIRMEKKALCLYRVQDGRKLSAMIAGCPGVLVREYKDFNDVMRIIDDFQAIDQSSQY
jgi:hypothetical protein